MAVRGSFTPYRRSLTPNARALRRNATPAEKKLWIQFLRDLPEKFTRQKPLGEYIADFYCASCKLVIEVDGDSHFSEPGEVRDLARTARLEQGGLKVLRFTNEDVMQRFEAVCLEIAAVLKT